MTITRTEFTRANDWCDEHVPASNLTAATKMLAELKAAYDSLRPEQRIQVAQALLKQGKEN